MCKNLREIPIKKSKRIEGVTLTLDENRAQWEEGSLLLFPGKNSANEKPWILCLLEPSQLSFTSVKESSFPFHVRISMSTPCEKGLIILADPKLQFSANPE